MAQKPDPNPYCANCGQILTGLTDSSKCPECGKPLVEVLRHHGQWGKRFRSKATLFGLPAIDVALGPAPGQRIGRARGVIAIGDRALGIVAIGGLARGVVAFGGTAIGIFAVGGFALGLLTAWGGLALALLANGGLTAGLCSAGGIAIGAMAVGGMAVGYFAAGGAVVGVHTAGAGGTSNQMIEMLELMSWYYGPAGNLGVSMIFQPLVVTVGLPVVIGGLMALLALVAHSRALNPGDEELG